MDKDTRPVTGGTPYKVKIAAHRPQLSIPLFRRDRGRWLNVYGTFRGADLCFQKNDKTDKSDKKE